MGLAVHVDADRAVVALHTRIPSRGGRGRVRHVAGLMGLGVERIVRVLARKGQGVETGEETARTVREVARGSDFAVAHPVADQNDDVLRDLVREGLTDEFGLVALQAARTAPGGDVALGGAFDRREGFGGVGCMSRAENGQGGSGGKSNGGELESADHGSFILDKKCGRAA